MTNGTMIKAISKKSMKNPKKNTKRLTSRRKASAPPGRLDRISAIQRSPSNPLRTNVNTVEPISRKMTITVRRTVSSITSCRILIENLLFKEESKMAPTAPKDPASVGVAIPMNMLPSTTRIKMIGGNIECSTLRAKAIPLVVLPASFIGGMDPGLTRAITMI